MGKYTRGSEHPVGKAGRRATSSKKKKPSPYMESVYHRIGSARVGYGQELPLNKNISKSAKGRWVQDKKGSGTYTTKKGKKTRVSAWTFVGETLPKRTGPPQ